MTARFPTAVALVALTLTTAACTGPSAPATSTPPTTPVAPVATAVASTPSDAPSTATASASASASDPAGASASATGTGPADSLQKIRNGRFGFIAAYPAAWNVDSPSGNGDGFTATGPDAATVTYAGANVISGPTIPAPCDMAREALKQSGVSLTYDSPTADGCVLSGTRADGHIVYERLWVGAASRNSMVWDYPNSAQDSVGPFIEQAGKAFEPGDLAVSH